MYVCLPAAKSQTATPKDSTMNNTGMILAFLMVVIPEAWGWAFLKGGTRAQSEVEIPQSSQPCPGE